MPGYPQVGPDGYARTRDGYVVTSDPGQPCCCEQPGTCCLPHYQETGCFWPAPQRCCNYGREYEVTIRGRATLLITAPAGGYSVWYRGQPIRLPAPGPYGWFVTTEIDHRYRVACIDGSERVVRCHTGPIVADESIVRITGNPQDGWDDPFIERSQVRISACPVEGEEPLGHLGGDGGLGMPYAILSRLGFRGYLGDCRSFGEDPFVCGGTCPLFHVLRRGGGDGGAEYVIVDARWSGNVSCTRIRYLSQASGPIVYQPVQGPDEFLSFACDAELEVGISVQVPCAEDPCAGPGPRPPGLIPTLREIASARLAQARALLRL